MTRVRKRLATVVIAAVMAIACMPIFGAQTAYADDSTIKIEKFFFDDGEYYCILNPGSSRPFGIAMTGTGIENVVVNWYVKDNKSDKTKIVSTGNATALLTIGEDESSGRITVHAFTKDDGVHRENICTVDINLATLTIDSVSIRFDHVPAYPGDRAFIYADVEGSAPNKDVTWSLTGQRSSHTTLTPGIVNTLVIGPDETATQLTITATSYTDSTKYGTYVLHLQQETKLHEIDLAFDVANMPLLTSVRAGDLSTWVSENVVSTTSGFNSSNKHLTYRDGDDSVLVLSSDESLLSAGKEYEICFSAKPIVDYGFPASVTSRSWGDAIKISDLEDFTVSVNGVVRDDLLVDYDIKADMIMVYIPIGKAGKCLLSDAEVTGVSDKTYTGEKITQSPVVTLNGETLEKDTDYEISYFNNLNAGTATMMITGKGDYKGAITKSFKINKKAITPAVTLSAAAFTYNGKVQKPTVTVKDGTTQLDASQYDVTYASGCKIAGTYQVMVALKDNYTGTASKTFRINKAANPLAMKGKTATVKYSKVKQKAQTLKVAKVIEFTKKVKDKKAYTLASAKKGKESFKEYFKISKSTGKVTVKKGLAKGTYKVKVKVKAGGNTNYKPSKVKAVTFTIKVK